ncbi:MAG TPA: PIN domain-containing protein [Candidatus Binatia bacterium]|nr:PIN domain-containing protein [Candidatus Binatia bacterium]
MSDGKWSIATLIERHRRIALDANVLIYLLEDVEGRSDRSAAIVDAVESGRLQASISALGHAEVLIGPARLGDAATFERTAAELRDAQVAIAPVTAGIAEDAAWLRGRRSIDLVDAIHLATARSVATAFITNDRRLRSTPGLEVFLLDDLELGEGAGPSGS